MDVYGLEPNGEQKPDVNWDDREQVDAYFAWQDNTKGSYFRANIWYWHPLWTYVVGSCQDILSKEDIERGYANDGHIISKKKAIKISERLQELSENGDTRIYAQEFEDNQNAYKDVECNICAGTGVRKGWEGWQSELEWLKHHESLENNNHFLDGNYEVAHHCKGCNGCKGTGRQKDSRTNYGFDKDYVKEFADFCKFSGGFKIC